VEKYDPTNWLKHSKESVYHTAKQGTLIALSKEYLSPLLLVRWTRNNYKEPVIGYLEAEIISPLGTLTRPKQEFEVFTDQQHYQLWSVQNDGLPYKLHARLIQNPKLSTQIEIWEYLPLIEQSVNNQSLQVSSNTGVTIVSYTSATANTPPKFTNKFTSIGSGTPIPLVPNAPMIIPADPTRLGGGSIANNTGKVLYVLESALPIIAAKAPAKAVAVGGNLDITEGYDGAIQFFVALNGTASLAATASIDITEAITP
jgi:hypothetical protein